MEEAIARRVEIAWSEKPMRRRDRPPRTVLFFLTPLSSIQLCIARAFPGKQQPRHPSVLARFVGRRDNVSSVDLSGSAPSTGSRAFSRVHGALPGLQMSLPPLTGFSPGGTRHALSRDGCLPPTRICRTFQRKRCSRLSRVWSVPQRPTRLFRLSRRVYPAHLLPFHCVRPLPLLRRLRSPPCFL